MKAYKFKSAAQADHIFDLILNQRLFCAPWDVLNDPMEGVFAYSFRGDDEARPAQELAAGVQAELKKLKVCSLARTFDCHLLWSHYANGFNGVAVELELPEKHPEIRPVSYRGVFGQFGYRTDLEATEVARKLLFSKYQEWQYEQELRIVSESCWFDQHVSVSRVIAGHRLHPALFEALQIVCQQKNVAFAKVGFGDEGIDADFVPERAKRIVRPPEVRGSSSTE